MSYDLLIKNGTVVDGTGAPQYQADIAVAAGKIADIGKITEGARFHVPTDDRFVPDRAIVGGIWRRTGHYLRRPDRSTS